MTDATNASPRRLWARQQLAQMPAHLRTEPWHDLRYELTAELLDRQFADRWPARVLDVGGHSPMTELMARMWPRSFVSYTNGQDVRYELSDQEPGYWDLVVMTEVLEHLHDLPTDDYHARAMWTGSGQRACLRLIRESLAPGGLCFLTTPNAVGLAVVERVLAAKRPMSFEPHVREMTEHEVAGLARECGLAVAQSGGWVCWAHHGLQPHRLHRVRELVGDRPDDLWFLLKAA